jgi:ribulose bisphosphate carboxylase small subunit
VGSINHSQAIRPDTAYLKKIIDSSLLADWAIRIEYQSDETATTSWELWDKAYFAIRSAKPVLEALLACYTKHPRSTIRISAEKFRPQTRLIYTVYNPQYLPAAIDSNTQSYPGQTIREHGQGSDQIRLIDR